MKSLYPGYFRPSEEDFAKMWSNNIFVFDTNIFLHFYRYSEDAQKELMSILDELKERLWIPRKVIDEFMFDRLDVLDKQVNKYKQIVKDVDSVLEKLENPREHPFIDSDLLTNLKSIFQRTKENLDENKTKLLDRAIKDETLEKMAEVVSGKIGNGFTEEDLEKIYLDGQKRGDNNLPPGYIDAKEKKKNTSNTNYRIYGDLIIWKEILSKSKNDKVGIIFVSDDKKEDWWLMLQEKTISPQPQLFKEFVFETDGQSFYMYTMDRFLEYYGEFRKRPVSKEIIQEAKEVREFQDSIVRDEGWRYIGEQEFVSKLKEYEEQYADEYVGIKRFVISYLRDLHNYEPNNSYWIMNSLKDKGLIRLYELKTGMGIARAISSIPIDEN